jgi:hypothetical protein
VRRSFGKATVYSYSPVFERFFFSLSAYGLASRLFSAARSLFSAGRAGQLLYEYARRIVALSDRAIDEISELRTRPNAL